MNHKGSKERRAYPQMTQMCADESVKSNVCVHLRSSADKLFAVLLVSLWFHLFAAVPARADTALLADGRSLFGEVHPGEAPGSLVLERLAEPAFPLKLDEMVGIDFGRGPAPETITVVLTTGERLAGKVSFPAPHRVAVARPDSAGAATEGAARPGGRPLSVELPLALCSSLRFTKPAPPPGPADVLLLANGDRITGKLLGVENGKALVQGSVGKLPIDLKRVAAITFARPPRADEAAAGRPGGAPGAARVLLELTSGEQIAGRWEALEEEAMRIRSDWGGVLTIPTASISRLLVQNGKLVFLSDLRPVEARHTPYLEIEHPHRIDESQGGRPLQLGGVRYGRGLGVHARSDLTYELAGGFKTFAATVGVDAEVGSAGSVVFRVLGDDKVLYESPVMRGGDDAREITVDVHGVLLLRLVVDFADNGDLGDHADWANARLLR
jgi:NPCBM/NEW2 domain